MLIPRLRVRTVYDINLAELKHKGYKGVIVDLDNTLVGVKEAVATDELITWLEQVKQAGFQVVIVSNNSYVRVSTFAAPIQIPFIHFARKPLQKAFHKALHRMKVKASATVVIGDQMLTDILGGNRLGMFTILVDPIRIDEEGWTTRLNRRIERTVKKRLRGKGLWHEGNDFERTNFTEM